jgi:hypothetical protein
LVCVQCRSSLKYLVMMMMMQVTQECCEYYRSEEAVGVLGFCCCCFAPSNCWKFCLNCFWGRQLFPSNCLVWSCVQWCVYMKCGRM